MQRHIVLVHRYFSPDTPPYAHILLRIGAALQARGHRVTVLTGQPSYRDRGVGRAPRREQVDGVDVVRFPVLQDGSSRALKAVNMLWFGLRVACARRHFRGADVVMAATTPPILVALVSSWAARLAGASFVYHKQDIWPEVRASSGSLLTGITDRLLRAVDIGTERRSSAVVVLSSDMAETLGRRSRQWAGGETPRVVVLNNFDAADDAAASTTREHRRSELNVVFAGNLGHFQGLVEVERLIRLVDESAPVRWHFFGDGPLTSRIAALQAERGSVVLHGFRPEAEVGRFLAEQGDLALVPLSPGVIRCAYPSKALTYLRHGCALLAVVEEDSELARLVLREEIGLTGSYDDLSRLAGDVEKLAADRSWLEAAGVRGRRVYEREMSSAQQLPRWVELVESVVAR